MTKLDDVVDAYVACGKAIGYFYAELILMKYLPDSKPDGKCYDVPIKKRSAFLGELKSATENGYQPAIQPA